MATLRKDGRWMARARLNGQRIAEYGTTREEADKKLAERLHAPLDTPTLWTLHETAKRVWYPKIESLAPATVSRYLAAYRHVRRFLGDVDASQIHPADIQRVVTSLGKDGMAPKGIHFVIGVLSAILNSAVENGIIQSNPCRFVRLPKLPDKRERFLSLDQAAKLTDECKGVEVFLACFCGLRAGEICGLRWSDLDRQTGTLRIQRQRGVDGKERELKTRSSKRTLHLTETMVAEIDRRGNIDSEYISGLTPRDIGHYWVRHWRPDWMKEWTFHDLRHAAAGLLYLMTRSEQAVRIILGHSSTSMTLSYIADESAPTRDAFQMLDKALAHK